MKRRTKIGDKKMSRKVVELIGIISFFVGIIFLAFSLVVFLHKGGDGNFPAWAGETGEDEIQGGLPWRTYEEAATSLTTALIFGWHELVCHWQGKHLSPPRVDKWHYDASQCSPPPYIPKKEYEMLGIHSFFIRGDRYFPIRESECADLLRASSPEEAEGRNWREAMIECLKRHGVKPEEMPPTKIPPNVLPPPPKDEPYTMFSLRNGDKTFEVDPRIYTKGKIGHGGSEPFWRRAVGIRITASGLQTLEDSVEGYLNQTVQCTLVNGSRRNLTKLNCEANKACMWTDNNNRCRSCCDSDGSCHPESDPPNNWCGNNQCPPGAGAPPEPQCPSGVPCPTFSGCEQSSYECMDIPVFGDCSAYDTYPCDTRVGGCGDYITNDWQCIYLSQGWGGQIRIELADCPYRNSFSCSPFTGTCSDDGLVVDAQVAASYQELFMRVANYATNLPGCPRCNTPQTEITCSSDCGRGQTCSCKCCSGAQAGCGIFHWPPGCPCCDDYIRLRFDLKGGPPAVVAYNLAFLLYGPTWVPYMTACGSPATTFKGSHPGEWLDLCACNQDVYIADYDSAHICDWGICGALLDLIENFKAHDVKCKVSNILNDMLSGALKSALSSSLPISLMEAIGACDLTGWDIGAYPEFCAGGSLGYSYNYSTGGAGIVLFSDAAARVTARASCVEQQGGGCPHYPTRVASTSCKTNPQACFPNAGGYNIGIYIDQEFINELLYVFWARGFLCFTFRMPWDMAKVLIPGIRQIITTPEDVNVSLVPVCGPTYTPQFSTTGGTFNVNIPRFLLRFRTATTNTQLFDIGMRMTLSGQLGMNKTTCHPADTLCPTNPTFRCQVCSISGCSDQNIPYGPGYFILSNITIDPVVTDISNRHPSIGVPANTDIADILVTLLNGAVNNSQITTRMYDILGLLPLKLNQINFFGFANNAFLIRYNLNPFCMNFILDFGNFTPPISKMLENGTLVPGLGSKSDTEEVPRIETMVSVEGSSAPRLKLYSSSSTFIHIRIPSDGRIRFRVMHNIEGVYLDPSTQRVKYFWWPAEGGLFWYKIDGNTFEFRPVKNVEEIEVFAAVEEISEEKGGPFYRIVDKTPVRIKIERGLEGQVLGPSELYVGRAAIFEVKSEEKIDRISYSLDRVNWSQFIEGNRFTFTPEEPGKFKLIVMFESGDMTGYAEKEIEVKGIGGVGGCGRIGIAGIIGMILIIFGMVKFKNGRNHKGNYKNNGNGSK